MIRALYLCALMLAMSAPAMAVGIFQLHDIYAARVPVAQQSQAALNKAFPAALAKVLVRVTGDAKAPSAQGMNRVLGKAAKLVQSYRYIEVANQQQTGGPAIADQQQAGGQAVQVRFDDDALNRLIRAHGLPIWGRERPQTLIWLAVRGTNQRRIVAADDASNAAAGLVDTALVRGVPVIFPLMDLQDQRGVKGSDVWGGFFDAIENASQRYPHTDVVVVNARQSGGGWQSEWTLLHQGQISAQWSASASSLNAALTGGTNQLADRYAKRFAVREKKGRTQTLHLVIDGVHDAADYARVSHYLNGLTAVQALQLDAVDGPRLIFALKTSSSRGYVRRVMSLDGLFTATDSNSASLAAGGGGEASSPPPAAGTGNPANEDNAADTGSASQLLEFTLKPKGPAS